MKPDFRDALKALVTYEADDGIWVILEEICDGPEPSFSWGRMSAETPGDAALTHQCEATLFMFPYLPFPHCVAMMHDVMLYVAPTAAQAALVQIEWYMEHQRGNPPEFCGYDPTLWGFEPYRRNSR